MAKCNKCKLPLMEHPASMEDSGAVCCGEDTTGCLHRQLAQEKKFKYRVCKGCDGLISGGPQHPCDKCGSLAGEHIAVGWVRRGDKIVELETIIDKLSAPESNPARDRTKRILAKYAERYRDSGEALLFRGVPLASLDPTVDEMLGLLSDAGAKLMKSLECPSLII